MAVNICEEFCLRIEDGQCVSVCDTWPNIGALVTVFLKNALVLAGVLFLLLLIFGGLGLIMGAGSGDAKKTAQGQKTITTALVGFFLVVAGYWLIQLIEIVTGINFINPNLK